MNEFESEFDEGASDTLSEADSKTLTADIRLAAMDLLSRREHSLCELKLKLRKRFKHSQLIEEQLFRLQDQGLQSDSRFAESFLRERLSRGQGPIRIRQEMRQRGIDDGLINLAIEQEDPNWHELAGQAYSRKFGELPAEELKEKARRSRFMQYRGFPADYFQHLLEL